MGKVKSMLILLVIPLAGCAITKNVTPATALIPIGSDICIELNQAVIDDSILPVVEDGVRRNGYRPVVYRSIPADCKFSMLYTARQKWDFVRFTSSVDIRLFNEGQMIGSIEYRLPAGVFGSGGVNPEKFDSTENKIGPLIDRLFN